MLCGVLKEKKTLPSKKKANAKINTRTQAHTTLTHARDIHKKIITQTKNSDHVSVSQLDV